MTTEEATKISIHPYAEEPVMDIIFCWTAEPYQMIRERGLAITSRDGRVTMTLSTTDVRELHRLLGEALADPAHDALVGALEKARRDLRDYGAAPIQQVREEMKRALEEDKR
ncbi:hypothetical protein LCGC14_1103820 [marine sediment metagenome]|uniref:Uncharacterized protein n=1 Tax=marine sediment metagenome TaxID=412755 RepID=A0A0F9MDA1_9ZZZZ